MTAETLSFVWAGIIAFAVLAYVLLDGFDLGVGLLFPFATPGRERDQMMNSVAPVWDGNETWLVMGGGGLLAAFPLAYSIVLPALYAPLVAMLLGLVLRGVAFEFRWRTKRGQILWDFAFFAGSLVATFAQGIALGALAQGIPIAGRAYAGGWWNWLSPFSLATGASLVIGYGLLGACWLNMKLAGTAQVRARGTALLLAPLLLACIGGVSLWTPFLNPVYSTRWFAWPALLYSGIVPLLLLVCFGMMWRDLRRGQEILPFLLALSVFVLCFMGIGISFSPWIVPPTLSIIEAAAPPASLNFMLPGVLALLPVILGYTAYNYWVFRGKVDEAGGYH